MELKVSDERAAEISEREAKATRGPWAHSNYNSVHDKKGSLVCLEYDAEYPKDEARITKNFAFIAHARRDIPDLLADRAALLARIAELEAEIGMTKMGFEK